MSRLFSFGFSGGFTRKCPKKPTLVKGPGFLWSIALPLVRPTLAIIALLTGIRAWNDFQWPLIITDTPELRPIQVGLTIFRSDVSTNFQLLMAGSVLAVAPVLILFLLTQRQFIQGIARTGIRG